MDSLQKDVQQIITRVIGIVKERYRRRQKNELMKKGLALQIEGMAN